MTKFGQNFGFFTQPQPGSSVVSANDDETARVNEGRRVSSKSPSLARAVEEVMSKETDETRFKSFFKSWQLTLKLDSDHTWWMDGLTCRVPWHRARLRHRHIRCTCWGGFRRIDCRSSWSGSCPMSSSKRHANHQQTGLETQRRKKNLMKIYIPTFKSDIGSV